VPPAKSARIPPYDIASEQSVLGGLLLDKTAFDKVADKIDEDDFWRRDHRLIFRAISDLAHRNVGIDRTTVSGWLRDRDLLDQTEGTDYLDHLAKTTSGASQIVAYATIVREKAILRRAIDAGTQMITMARASEGLKVDEILEKSESAIFALAERGARNHSGPRDLRSAVREAFDLLQTRYQNRGQLTGLPTGFTELDEMTSGLQPTDLIIVAARPAMGKTAFALNIAEHACQATRKGVGVFSLEMSSMQLTLRLMSGNGGIDQSRLRSGRLKDEDWGGLTSASVRLEPIPLFIDDTPALSPLEVRSRARRLARQCDLGLIVVDYLQLMHVPGNKENRASEVAVITGALKALAKELNIPVIALSQLNRGLEQRADKRPVMADLRESGSIEQDADIILFLYRDDYYNKDSTDAGRAEVIIGKHRNGPTGTVRLAFDGKHTRFTDALRSESDS